MKKVIYSMAAVAIAAVLVVGAVFAAQSLVLEPAATITYKMTNAYVTITGSSTLGDDKSEEVKSYEDNGTNAPKDNPVGGKYEWTIGTIALNETDHTVTITITIKNDGRNKVDVSFGDLTLDESLEFAATVGGTEYNRGSISSATAVLEAAGAASDADKVVIVLTISIKNYLAEITSASFSLPITIAGRTEA